MARELSYLEELLGGDDDQAVRCLGAKQYGQSNLVITGQQPRQWFIDCIHWGIVTQRPQWG